MLVIVLCTACFFRAKINKNLGHPTFRFGPPTLNGPRACFFRAKINENLGPLTFRFGPPTLNGAGTVLRSSRRRQHGFAPNFFQGLGGNTWSLQPALKSSAPPLQVNECLQKRSSPEISTKSDKFNA